MDTSDKSDSTMIKQHYTEIVHTLRDLRSVDLMHSLFADSNAIDHYAKWLFPPMMMMTQLHYSMLAHSLVGYVIDNIDNKEHCNKIWEALDHVNKPLSDIVTKMKSKRG